MQAELNIGNMYELWVKKKKKRLILMLPGKA